MDSELSTNIIRGAHVVAWNEALGQSDQWGKEFDAWLDAEKAEAFDEGEQNVYIGRYDQYDTGSRMMRRNNPYRKD